MNSQSTQHDQPAPAALRLTPRTDAAIQSVNAAHFRGKIIAPAFAAALERELNEESLHVAKLKQDREELWKEIAAAKHSDSGYAVLQQRNEKELVEMQRQRDEAREQSRCRDVQIAGITNDLLTARDDAARLASAFRRYAAHDPDCLNHERRGSCTCGLDQNTALAAHSALTGGKKA